MHGAGFPLEEFARERERTLPGSFLTSPVATLSDVISDSTNQCFGELSLLPLTQCLSVPLFSWEPSSPPAPSIPLSHDLYLLPSPKSALSLPCV